MLYGIIADVHSNLQALSAVLGQLHAVDQIICCGDLVGYGPEPNECVEKIKELGISSVAGNHDKVALSEMSSEWFNENAKRAIEWTQDRLTVENVEYLRSLPVTLEFDDFKVVHGSLRSPLEEYIANLTEALPTFELMTKPLCFTGHLHKPLLIGQKKDGNYDGKGLADGEEVLTDDYDRAIINPGGVGQPRDLDPRASYGVYNDKTKIFSLHRVAYDVELVQKKMKEANLPQFLIDRLSIGR